MKARRARARNTVPPRVPPTMAPKWARDVLWLGWPFVKSEPEVIAAPADDSGEGEGAGEGEGEGEGDGVGEGEGEGEGDGDWLEREVEMVWASDVTNVLKTVWVLVGVVVVPSTVLAVALDVGVNSVATETVVLSCADVVGVETALDAEDISVSWVAAVEIPSCTVCV